MAVGATLPPHSLILPESLGSPAATLPNWPYPSIAYLTTCTPSKFLSPPCSAFRVFLGD